MKQLLKILLPNGAIFGVVTLTNLELALKITLLVLSIAYTTLHIAVLWRKLSRPETK